MNAPGTRGRLAPSPTGLLHLGNAWAFWGAWLSARASGGDIVLRIEDIDPARSKPEYATALMDDLAWLGLDWDYGPGKPGKPGKPGNAPGNAPGNGLGKSDTPGESPGKPPGNPPGNPPGESAGNDAFFYQSERVSAYETALRDLEAAGLVYPCYCTRKELREIAGAPHVDDAGAAYPGTCRALTDADKKRLDDAGRKCSLRLVCPPETVWTFDDMVMGAQRATLRDCGGDFALRRSDGVYAYQLAVVVDDIAMGVTEVVRGNDIAVSTPRQMYLYSLFGEPAPRYGHVPLVVDADGERLAKRHASLTLRALRDAGVRPETVLGWLAAAAGLCAEFTPIWPGEVLEGFSLQKIRAASLRLPPDPVARCIALQK